MAVRLLVKQRSEAGGADKSTEVVLNEETINLGREKGCHVVLAQQAVSRNHAQISRDGQLFFIEDLGSAYGTQVNGQSLPKGEKRLLRNGDVIAIAQFDITFERISDAVKGSNQDKTSFVARQAVKDLLRGGGDGEAPCFRIMNGPREGQRIEVPDARELVIGRDDDLDIVFKDDLVSRRHAKIRRDWSGTHVEDLQSRNGIKVNKKRTTRRTLKDRDEVEVGGIRLLYLDPTAVPDQPLSLHPPGEPTSQEEDDALPLPNGTEAPVRPAPAPPEPPAAQAQEPPPEPEPQASQAPEASAGSEEAEPLSGSTSLGGESGLESAPLPGVDETRSPGMHLTQLASTPRALIPLVALGVFVLLALGFIIAVFVGA